MDRRICNAVFIDGPLANSSRLMDVQELERNGYTLDVLLPQRMTKVEEEVLGRTGEAFVSVTRARYRAIRLPEFPHHPWPHFALLQEKS